jgi:hypothetical protein
MFPRSSCRRNKLYFSYCQTDATLQCTHLSYLLPWYTSHYQGSYFARKSQKGYDGLHIRWFLSRLARVCTCACVSILSVHFEATVKVKERPCPLQLDGSMKYITRSADSDRISYKTNRPWAIVGCRQDGYLSWTCWRLSLRMIIWWQHDKL